MTSKIQNRLLRRSSCFGCEGRAKSTRLRADARLLAGRHATPNGFTLVEVLIAVGVFALVAVGIYGAYVLLTRLTAQSRATVVGLQLAQEKLELARNLPFGDVGVAGGVPPGVLAQTETVNRDGLAFTLTTTVRNIDDPFDGDFGGTIPGKPRDTAPADYKRIEIRISCAACPVNPPILLTTNVAPKGLEGASTNGAMFITVFDANGQPVPQATVRIQNSAVAPAIDFTDTTDNSGKLQIVDIPPSVERYEVTVTKPGYSSDRTLAPGAPENPNPLKPHATVVAQTITEISFSIDRVSSANLATVNELCQAVGNTGVHLEGAKIIGQNPTVFKTVIDTTTAGDGRRTLTDLEWDSYSVNVTSAGYDIAGTIPFLPLNLLPNSAQNVTLVLAPDTARSLRVLVRDSVTGLPLPGAQVRLQRGAFDETRETGKGYVRQTDWSGGAGQATFTDPSRYWSDNGDVDVTSSGPGPGGSIMLRQFGGAYQTPGILTSSTVDFEGPTNFTNITWSPGSQPPPTGTSSVAFQVATNNDNQTWAFRGPDGTASTSYTVIGSAINPIHNGSRYFRYQAKLSTESATNTPEISDVAITFTASCTPPGQVFFPGLANGQHDLTVSYPNYQAFIGQVDVSADTVFEVVLNP